MGVNNTLDAKRLLITETARVQSEAQKLHYQETMGADATIEFVAKLDDRTTDECRGANGNKIKVSEMVAGVNVPPLHPYCRSTTAVPAVDDIDDELEAFFKEREGKYSLKELDDIEAEENEPDEPDELVFNDNLTEVICEEQTDELKRKFDTNKDAEGAAEFRKIWNHYADELKLEKRPKNRGAHYDPSANKVRMNTDNLAERDVLGRGANQREGKDKYSTVIHEFAHMLDYNTQRDFKGAKNMIYGSYSSEPNNYEPDDKGDIETLAEVIKKELDAKAKAEQKELKYQYDNNITDGWSSPSKPKLNDGRRALVKRYKEQYHLGATLQVYLICLRLLQVVILKLLMVMANHIGRNTEYIKHPYKLITRRLQKWQRRLLKRIKGKYSRKSCPQSYALIYQNVKS